jgi:hypothetical protein
VPLNRSWQPILLFHKTPIITPIKKSVQPGHVFTAVKPGFDTSPAPLNSSASRQLLRRNTRTRTKLGIEEWTVEIIREKEFLRDKLIMSI